MNQGEIVNRKISFFKSAVLAVGMVASLPAAAQVAELSFGQSLTPTDKNHTSELRSEFDGRTIRLQTALYLQDPDLTLEDMTPPAFIAAACRPGHVSVILSANKYLQGYMGRALPEGARAASTKWAITKRAKILEAQLIIRESQVVVAFGDKAAVELLGAIYEETSQVDLVLIQVEGEKLAQAVPTIVIKINRSKKQSISALAQTPTYCETMATTRL